MQHQCLLHVDRGASGRALHVAGVRRTGTGRRRITARENDEQKAFRIDRIDSLRVGPTGSASPPQPVVKDSDPLRISDGEPITVLVLTDHGNKYRVLRDLGPRGVKENDSRKDRAEDPGGQSVAVAPLIRRAIVEYRRLRCTYSHEWEPGTSATVVESHELKHLRHTRSREVSARMASEG